MSTDPRADVERLRDLIAKLRHPMVSEQGFHIGKFCQEEREEAAAALESLLPKGTADGTAR